MARFMIGHSDFGSPKSGPVRAKHMTDRYGWVNNIEGAELTVKTDPNRVEAHVVGTVGVITQARQEMKARFGFDRELLRPCEPGDEKRPKRLTFDWRMKETQGA